LELDFSEEDLEVVPKEKYVSVIETSITKIETLVTSFQRNRQFGKGIEVLIAGKPNVGKSSLMNSLLEKDRVIVSHIPGTTRDLVHEDIIMEDTLVRLIDTAGIRFTEDEVEAEGVSRAKKLLNSCEIVLIVLDVSESLDSDDIEIINNLLHNKYITEDPIKFSTRQIAESFVEDGLKLALSDSVITDSEMLWLNEVAEINEISPDWFEMKLNEIKSKSHLIGKMDFALYAII